MNSGGELGDTERGCGTRRGATGTGSGTGICAGGARCGDGAGAGSDRRSTARPDASEWRGSGRVRARSGRRSLRRAGLLAFRVLGWRDRATGLWCGGALRRRGAAGDGLDMPRPLDAPIKLITSGAAPAPARSRKARTTTSRKPRTADPLATGCPSSMLSETAVGWHAAAASKTLRLGARSSLLVAAGGAKMFRPGSATAPVPKLSRGSSMTSAHEDPRDSELAPSATPRRNTCRTRPRCPSWTPEHARTASTE